MLLVIVVVLILFVVGLAVVVTLAGITMHNSLIDKKNRVEENLSGIDVQLKKRYDLIPDLVSSVKKYMKHEENLLKEIVNLREQAQQSDDIMEENKINQQLDEKTSQLEVKMEAYPELKANENIDTLMKSLNEVEAQISAARRSYNAAVRQYNNGLEMFPSSLVASIINLERKEMFAAEEKEKADVNVDDLFAVEEGE